jgi:hypothetical protein
MSENAPKILIVVLVVLVVLFFVGIGVGGGDGIGSISADGVINRLAGLFPSTAVNPDEIQPTDCYDRNLQRIIVPGGIPGGACQLQIRESVICAILGIPISSGGGECPLQILESSVNVRSLKLEMAGGEVHLELVGAPVEGQEMTSKADLPNKQITLTIPPSGGSLVINACVPSGGSNCVINIVSSIANPNEIDAFPSGCFDQILQRIVIPSGGECALQIAESSADRSLKLENVNGAVHLELIEGQETIVESDLPDKQINLTIYSSGGSLVINACVPSGGSNCVINIVN